MDKIKFRLLHNLNLKLISVAVAFFVWLLIVNISNPETRDTVTVDIGILNDNVLSSADKSYTMDAQAVRVSYKVRTAYQQLVTREDFHAYIDMKDYSITGAVPVYLEVSENAAQYIQTTSLTPMVVHIATEDIQEKLFNVELRTTGEVASGYVLGEGEVDPGHVYVRGPVSMIGRISSVGIEVDVSGLTETQVSTGDLKFYDANGNPIKVDQRVSYRGSFEYVVPVYRIKTLTINAQTSGAPAPGYQVGGVDLSPSSVDVYGTEEQLAGAVVVNIPPSRLNIDGSMRNVVLTVDISDYLPEGLSLAQPQSEITIIVKVTAGPQTGTGQQPPMPVNQGQTRPQPTQPPETEASEPETEPELPQTEPETSTVSSEYGPHVGMTEPANYDAPGRRTQPATDRPTQAETEAPIGTEGPEPELEQSSESGGPFAHAPGGSGTSETPASSISDRPAGGNSHESDGAVHDAIVAEAETAENRQ